MASEQPVSKAGQYSRKPAYQNTFKYKHNPKSVKTAQIAASPIEGLCEHCSRLLEWKKDYRKYKPLTVPKRCTLCQQKNIINAYHIVCSGCATKNKMCAKCKKPVEAYVKDFHEAKRVAEEEKKFEEEFSKLRLRDQKKVMRQIQKDRKAGSSSEEEEGTDDNEGSKESIDEGSSFDDSVSDSENSLPDIEKLAISKPEAPKSKPEPVIPTESQPTTITVEKKAEPAPVEEPTKQTVTAQPGVDQKVDESPAPAEIATPTQPEEEPTYHFNFSPTASPTKPLQPSTPPADVQPVVAPVTQPPATITNESEDQFKSQDQLKPLTDQLFGGVQTYKFNR